MIDRLAQTFRSALPADAFVSRNEAKKFARQILTVLQEPSEEMKAVGAAFFDLDEEAGKKAAALVFSDMISAALGEAET